MKRPIMITDIARQADGEIAGHLTAAALKRLITRTERLLADPVYFAKHKAKIEAECGRLGDRQFEGAARSLLASLRSVQQRRQSKAATA
jgi:hypothetical protein